MSVKTAGVGHFTIPTAPAAGTSVTSGAANVFTTTYVQLIASTAAALYITGIHVEKAAASAATYCVIQLASGAAAAETIIGQYLVPLSTGSTVALGYRPIFPPIPVANATRIAVKSADSVGAQAALVTLECIAQSNVVDDGITVGTVNLVNTLTTYTGNTVQTGDSFARLGAPAGASHSADVAAVKVDTAAVKVQTDKLIFTVAGYLDVNAYKWVGGTIPAVNVTGVPLIDLKYTLGTISPAAAGSVRADAVTGAVGSVTGAVGSVTGNVAGSVGSVTAAVTVGTNNDKTGYSLTTLESLSSHSGTAQAGAAGSITLAAGASATDSLYVGSAVKIYGGTGAGQTRVISAYVGATKVATVARNWATAPDATSTYSVLALAVPKVNDNLEVTAAAVNGSVTGSVASVTGAVGSVTGNVGGNVVGTVGSVVGAVGSVNGAVGSVTAAVTLPTIPANWITAAGIAAAALNGKGDWLLSSAYTAPDNTSIATLIARLTAARATNLDNLDAAVSSRMAGFTLPPNFSSLTISVAGAVTAGTVGDKTGYALTAAYDAAKTALAAASYTAPDNASVAAVKAKTDGLSFTRAGEVDVNIQSINDRPLTGTGAAGDLFTV